MSKQKFYNLKNLISQNCEYNILFGERSNGKSYAVKAYCLYVAYFEQSPFGKNDPFFGEEKIIKSQFAYLRRWDMELHASDIEAYFSDMVENEYGDKYIYELTGGEYSTISAWRKSIYFANVDADGKIIRGKKIGQAFAITQDTHYKSLQFPLIGRVIFEEFITNTGYIKNEPNILFSIVSTIFRRSRGQVFLIGNTISRACPYFSAWGLIGTLKQEIGTIEKYVVATDQRDERGKIVKIKIAVEYCSNSGNNSKMFFGKSSKMITSGNWESEEQPKLPRPREEYILISSIYYDFSDLLFRAELLQERETGINIVYVSEIAEIPQGEIRLISDKNFAEFTSENKYFLRGISRSYLTDIYKYDKIIMVLINTGFVVFSDDLTGTEFRRIHKEFL